MKKLIMFLMLGFWVSSSYAQDETDNNPYAAGTININAGSSLNIEFAAGTPYQLFVGGGYFVIDKLMIGASFSAFDVGLGSDTAISLGARYNVYNQLHSGISYDFETERFSVAVGYDIFLSDKIALTPTFTYVADDRVDPTLSAFFNVYF